MMPSSVEIAPSETRKIIVLSVTNGWEVVRLQLISVEIALLEIRKIIAVSVTSGWDPDDGILFYLLFCCARFLIISFY